MKEELYIKGAREHNLKNISLRIPRNKFIVFTGVSGSGKSSLAFDTIYAEGQRRYVESLSSYARQFLGQMDKPDVDLIEGLSPAVAINQKGVSNNPRSTVGTITEVYDYLRVLYARIGTPYCYICGKPITRQTVDQIVDRIMEFVPGTRFQVLSPIIRGRKGEYSKTFENIRKDGFVRIRVDGEIYELGENFDLKLDRNIKHNIEIIIDRLKIKPGVKKRLAEDIEISLKESGGTVYIQLLDNGEIISFSENFSCVDCGISYEELTPRMFSFNSPYGACGECSGLGISKKIDADLIVENPGLSIIGGAIPFFNMNYSNYYSQLMRSLAQEYSFDLNMPFEDFSEEIKKIILYGTGKKKIKISYRNHKGHIRVYYIKFEGLANNLSRRYLETESDYQRNKIEKMVASTPCHSCKGKRLKKESLAVKINGLSIADFCEMTIEENINWLKKIKLSKKEKLIGERLVKEIFERLIFLKDVGLGYLTLERKAGTLSGGESQRIRLATQIGSGLVGVLYILDEPSIGLHQRDNRKLIDALKRLKDLGNTIIVIEHDEETMRASDYIVDIGPGAGIYGGKIVFNGPVEEIYDCRSSITGKYLKGEKFISIPEKRREGNGKSIVIKGARQNNLKNIDVEIALGKMIAVTGVSGSGKSTLINEILFPALSNKLMRSRLRPGSHSKILNPHSLDKVIVIDQSPIGRTPRSNPSTYTGAFTYIRELFSKTHDARLRGYKPGRFSFNVKGGRCEYCNGDGMIKIEMHFLPDVYVPCEVCKGKRFNRDTLEIKYKGKNIDDILNMTVEEGLDFFENIPRIKNKLKLINDVGLGYIKLGQSSTTLSGGEAQRVKLSTELSKRSTGNTLYLLDEPTTGLHFDDIDKLLKILDRLVDAGNTVLVIEHNMEVIKTADHIIDLGPEGGSNGGRVIASGTPEEVASSKDSYTGRFLKKFLKNTKQKVNA
ncbi:MAG TPA: excinuclease ABC subunit UvrA [Actinobacteria bacterium]|nr:excinuclease ABC subunit UvrA [Actinomycetota bacterium]